PDRRGVRGARRLFRHRRELDARALPGRDGAYVGLLRPRLYRDDVHHPICEYERGMGGRARRAVQCARSDRSRQARISALRRQWTAMDVAALATPAMEA